MAGILEGAAAKYAAIKYGGPMAQRVDVVSVGVTQVQVLTPNPERVFALLVNLSPNLIYLGYDESVGSARGIFIAANGGSYEVNIEEDLVIPTFEHFAVSTGVTSNLYVTEVFRFTSNELMEAQSET